MVPIWFIIIMALAFGLFFGYLTGIGWRVDQMKWTPIIAMVCIAGLEAFALAKGVNGAGFGLVVAALAGLGGYELKAYWDKKKGGQK